MTKTKIAITLLTASLILLLIYGADVIVASSTTTSPVPGFSEHNGFLPFNKAIRGSVLGGSAVIMSIIAFIISRKEPSSAVSTLLMVV
jgi:hypothetical protein